MSQRSHSVRAITAAMMMAAATLVWVTASTTSAATISDFTARQDTTHPYCVVASQPVGVKTPAPSRCFTTFGASIEYATGGQVKLSNAESSREVTAEELQVSANLDGPAPMVTTVVSIHYSQTGYSGSTYTITQNQNPAGTCGYTQLSSFTSGWNDNIRSTRTYGNCATTLFWAAGFGVPTYPIKVNQQVSTLGVFNDQSSSEKWCPVYVCS